MYKTLIGCMLNKTSPYLKIRKNTSTEAQWHIRMSSAPYAGGGQFESGQRMIFQNKNEIRTIQITTLQAAVTVIYRQSSVE